LPNKQFIQEFQTKLANTYNTGYQSWWNKFIFHYSDVRNVVSILNSGKLYSRNKAIENGLMTHDNANDDVIFNTGLDNKDYVRFYFGAMTPTQYSNQGIKQKSQIINNAHCPVPIFLLFDFVNILNTPNVHFSNGNIASANAEIYNNIQDLKKLEFHYIYDRTALPDSNYRYHILYCRNAEVLVPHEVNVFDSLKYVCVRSEADKETLLYNLTPEKRTLLNNKIRVTNNGLYFQNRLLLNKVYIQVEDNYVIFEFLNANNSTFDITLTIVGDGNILYNKSYPNFMITQKVSAELPDDFKYPVYIKLEFDDNLIYKNEIINTSEHLIF